MRYLAALGKGSILCFPTRQLSHSSLACLMKGSPHHLLLCYPPERIEAQKHAYHNHDSSFCRAAKHTSFTIFKSSIYRRFLEHCSMLEMLDGASGCNKHLSAPYSGT